MKTIVATLLIFFAPASAAEEWAGSDAVFYQRFIPIDETTARYQDVLEWRVQRCTLSQEGDWLIEFDLVGHEDPAMESLVINDGNQPIYIAGQGWVPTLDFDIDSFCQSYAS